MNSIDGHIERYLGALPRRDGSTLFRVWAPFAEMVSVDIIHAPGKLQGALIRGERDYFEGRIENTGHGDLYRYVIDGRYALPDPVSRSQPEGVHGHSQIIDHDSFCWDDNGWQGIRLEEYIIYELHVGTFTNEGTFEAVTGCLEYLKDLGINAIELMPVSQFPGGRNWGYDGTFPFAPQNTYGGPQGLKTLVNACHGHGIAVILDVVYNHLGPEGNYLGKFGPYFTDRYQTPWGEAINFDGPLSDEVRHYFIESALAWITDYHIDALRIDAIHGIFDFSALTFLENLAGAVRDRSGSLGRASYLIAESDLNDIRVITPARGGGLGLDAQWNDDFHHALHTLLTGEQNGYYQDFGTVENLAKSYREGYVYTGQFSPYRQRKHGSPSRHRPVTQFVVFSQNHDQVGNRALGNRLGGLVPPDKLRIAAVAVMLSPYIPLLFMGEEYGEIAPFLYFMSYGDEALIDAVRVGRSEEFASFDWKEGIPDPQAEGTFMRSKIDRKLRFSGPHSFLFRFYRDLLALRRTLRPWDMKNKRPAAKPLHNKKTLSVLMPLKSGDIACFFNFSEDGVNIPPPFIHGSWAKILDTLSPRWGTTGEKAPPRIRQDIGPAAPLVLGPLNAVIYKREP